MITIWLYGTACGEFLQWAAWIKARPGKSPFGYWRESVAHFLIVLSVSSGGFYAWREGGIAWVMSKTGSTEFSQFVSAQPPFGFLLAAIFDMYADKLAFGFRNTLESKVPFLASKPTTKEIPE